MDGIEDLAWIIRARTSCEAEAGHPAQAWDMVLMQLRFADSLRLDPASSTQYTRLVCRPGLSHHPVAVRNRPAGPGTRPGD